MKRSTNHFVLSGLLVLTVLVGLIGAGSVLAPVQAWAQDIAYNQAIRLTPKQSKILHLNKSAASVVVANPAHASVFLDTPRIVVIVPGAAGATSFIVLDEKGNEIMQRDIIVSERQEKYVRIQRVCTAGAENCVARSVYYCPEGCHQIVTSNADDDVSGAVSGGGGESAPIPVGLPPEEETSETGDGF